MFENLSVSPYYMRKSLTALNAELMADKTKLEFQVLGLETQISKEEEAHKKADTDIRLELSRALGAPIVSTQEYGYSSRKEAQTVYTWFEIFRELGKLLEKKKREDTEQVVNEALKKCAETDEEVRGWLRRQCENKASCNHFPFQE